jgi:hypothetical protein
MLIPSNACAKHQFYQIYVLATASILRFVNLTVHRINEAVMSLDLSGNWISDEGASALAEALRYALSSTGACITLVPSCNSTELCSKHV